MLCSFWSIGLSTLVLAVASACTVSTSPAVPQAGPSATAVQAAGNEAQKPATKLGVLADVTGVAPFAGAQERLNTDLRVSQINASGGVNGHALQAIYVDPGSDPGRAQQPALQLVQQDNVDVLMGGVLTPECAGVAGIAAQMPVVYLTAEGCAGDQVTGWDCNKYTFRLYPVGVQTTTPLAQFMVQTYGKRWGII
jgi:ABC-type branched-subunit amino acid transport system substrate-binding protein